MSDVNAQAAAPPAPPRKKRKVLKWILIPLFLLLLLGGGGAATWWFFFRPAPTEGEGGQPAAKAEHKLTGDGVLALDQFLVNLADKDTTRFVRVKLALVVATKQEAKELGENEVVKARLRSAIIELLTQQLAEKLTTPEGKSELKKQIAERCAPALGEVKVLDVLFTDFVVQF